MTRCVDTGTDGDPNPAMILADIVPRSGADSTSNISESTVIPEVKKVDLAAEEEAPPRFVLTFTEDKNGFYINRQKFALHAAPMVRAKVGSYQHWKIVNATAELHPMHIHQVHFLAYAENDKPIANPVWLGTVNVPYGGPEGVAKDLPDPGLELKCDFYCPLWNYKERGLSSRNSSDCIVASI